MKPKTPIRTKVQNIKNSAKQVFKTPSSDPGKPGKIKNYIQSKKDKIQKKNEGKKPNSPVKLNNPKYELKDSKEKVFKDHPGYDVRQLQQLVQKKKKG